MQHSAARKYGNDVIPLHAPSRAPAMRTKTPAEIRLDITMHTLFRAIATACGWRFGRAHQEILEGRQAPWRYLARRLVEMKRHHVSKRHALAVIRELEDWVMNDLYADEQEVAA